MPWLLENYATTLWFNVGYTYIWFNKKPISLLTIAISSNKCITVREAIEGISGTLVHVIMPVVFEIRNKAK
jgi:hypothetical protein